MGNNNGNEDNAPQKTHAADQAIEYESGIATPASVYNRMFDEVHAFWRDDNRNLQSAINVGTAGALMLGAFELVRRLNSDSASETSITPPQDANQAPIENATPPRTDATQEQTIRERIRANPSEALKQALGVSGATGPADEYVQSVMRTRSAEAPIGSYWNVSAEQLPEHLTNSKINWGVDHEENGKMYLKADIPGGNQGMVPFDQYFAEGQKEAELKLVDAKRIGDWHIAAKDGDYSPTKEAWAIVAPEREMVNDQPTGPLTGKVSLITTFPGGMQPPSTLKDGNLPAGIELPNAKNDQPREVSITLKKIQSADAAGADQFRISKINGQPVPGDGLDPRAFGIHAVKIQAAPKVTAESDSALRPRGDSLKAAPADTLSHLREGTERLTPLPQLDGIQLFKNSEGQIAKAKIFDFEAKFDWSAGGGLTVEYSKDGVFRGSVSTEKLDLETGEAKWNVTRLEENGAVTRYEWQGGINLGYNDSDFEWSGADGRRDPFGPKLDQPDYMGQEPRYLSETDLQQGLIDHLKPFHTANGESLANIATKYFAEPGNALNEVSLDKLKQSLNAENGQTEADRSALRKASNLVADHIESLQSLRKFREDPTSEQFLKTPHYQSEAQIKASAERSLESRRDSVYESAVNDALDKLAKLTTISKESLEGLSSNREIRRDLRVDVNALADLQRFREIGRERLSSQFGSKYGSDSLSGNDASAGNDAVTSNTRSATDSHAPAVEAVARYIAAQKAEGMDVLVTKNGQLSDRLVASMLRAVKEDLPENSDISHSLSRLELLAESSELPSDVRKQLLTVALTQSDHALESAPTNLTQGPAIRESISSIAAEKQLASITGADAKSNERHVAIRTVLDSKGFHPEVARLIASTDPTDANERARVLDQVNKFYPGGEEAKNKDGWNHILHSGSLDKVRSAAGSAALLLPMAVGAAVAAQRARGAEVRGVNRFDSGR